MSREQWIWTVPSTLMKESAYSHANAPSDVHVFLCEMELNQDAYRREVIEQTHWVYPATASDQAIPRVEISVNSVGANVQGWGDSQAMTLSIVPSA